MFLAEQAAMEARRATEGERKTITALFADIKDSTALIEDLDPEKARRLIDPTLAPMMEAAEKGSPQNHDPKTIREACRVMRHFPSYLTLLLYPV